LISSHRGPDRGDQSDPTSTTRIFHSTPDPPGPGLGAATRITTAATPSVSTSSRILLRGDGHFLTMSARSPTPSRSPDLQPSLHPRHDGQYTTSGPLCLPHRPLMPGTPPGPKRPQPRHSDRSAAERRNLTSLQRPTPFLLRLSPGLSPGSPKLASASSDTQPAPSPVPIPLSGFTPFQCLSGSTPRKHATTLKFAPILTRFGTVSLESI
jgi:hypothetical protein